MVRRDWEQIQAFMAAQGRKETDLTKAYSNFVYVLKKGEKPEAAVPHFSTISGMDLDFWRTYYLVGEAEEVAERIRAKVDALGGGVEHVILNPVNWASEQLELLAAEVLPRVAPAERRPA
jgi:alkanesulfonate monooxygenase SsuD/methylene tetrahydromethanopterin reductase-like flavin-dependent oxidoreductase (luciferase family)